jgi:hypothetical protein
MNSLVLLFIGMAAIALIVFLVIRNLKDKKQFEQGLNNDFPKNKKGEGDIEMNEARK